jgi:DNA-binding XRE family transcriptional regulator
MPVAMKKRMRNKMKPLREEKGMRQLDLARKLDVYQ